MPKVKVINGIDTKVLATTIKQYTADFKRRRAVLDKQYALLDKESSSLDSLEEDIRSLESVAKLVTILNKAKK